MEWPQRQEDTVVTEDMEAVVMLDMINKCQWVELEAGEMELPEDVPEEHRRQTHGEQQGKPMGSTDGKPMGSSRAGQAG